MNFKKEFSELLKKHGRKKGWVISQTNCPSRSFYALLDCEAFNNMQKSVIRDIITGQISVVKGTKIKLI